VVVVGIVVVGAIAHHVDWDQYCWENSCSFPPSTHAKIPPDLFSIWFVLPVLVAGVFTGIGARKLRNRSKQRKAKTSTPMGKP
jgi:hypothetical protein